MTPADLSRLESLAREATQGPWRQDYKRFSHVYPTGQNSAMSKPIAVVNGGTHTGTAANAAYIAAANPAAVLALIARVRELEADAARFRWLIKGAGSHYATGEDSYLSAIQWTSQNRRETMRDAIDHAMEWDKP